MTPVLHYCALLLAGNRQDEQLSMMRDSVLTTYIPCRCPDTNLNTLYFIGMSLVNVVMLIITIRAQLTRTLLDKDKQEEADAASMRNSGNRDAVASRNASIMPSQPKDDGSKVAGASEGNQHNAGEKARPSSLKAFLFTNMLFKWHSKLSSSKQGLAVQPDGQEQAEQVDKAPAERSQSAAWEDEPKPDENALVTDEELNQNTHSIVIKVRGSVQLHAPI